MSFPSTYLSHIKDLKAVTWSLGTDIHVPINDLHVTPHDWLGLSGQSALVFQAAVPLHLNEGCSVGLTNSNKFTTVWGSPAYVQPD